MPDRKQVIFDIERCICHVPDACRDCSHYQKGEAAIDCMEILLADALALLKEQEPVEPEVRQTPAGVYAVCGNCKYSLTLLMNVSGPQVNHLPKFCPECGREVKWDA